MSNIDKRALREAAEKALPAMKRLLMMPNDELFDEALLNVDGDVDAANAFNLLTGPETVLALLDELEAAEKRIADLELRLSQQQSIAANNLEMFRRADARVSELEAQEVHFSLPDELTAEDCDILARSIDYGTGWNLALSSCEEEFIRALTAAGIRINGEG